VDVANEIYLLCQILIAGLFVFPMRGKGWSSFYFQENTCFYSIWLSIATRDGSYAQTCFRTM